MPVSLAPLAWRAGFSTFLTAFFLLLSLACHHSFRGFGSMDGPISLPNFGDAVESCGLATVLSTAANNGSTISWKCNGHSNVVEVGAMEKYRSSRLSSNGQRSELRDGMASRQGFLKAVLGTGIGAIAAVSGLPKPANALLGK